MKPATARDILARCHTASRSFHALPSDVIASLIAEADERHYRAPRNANGSRARYFHAFLERVAARGDA